MSSNGDRPSKDAPLATIASESPVQLVPADEFSQNFGGETAVAQGARPAIPSPRSVLRRFGLMVVAIAVLVAAVGVPSVWLTVKPEYRATAVVRVSPVIPRLVENDKVIPFYDNFVNTQVGLIRSAEVLNDVLDDPGVQNTSWNRKLDPAERSERLLEGLSVSARPKSELIDVSMTVQNAADAKVLADAIANKYILRNELVAQQSDDKLFKELQVESGKLTSAISLNEQELARIRRAAGHGSPVELLNERTTHLEELNSKLQALNVERAAVQSVVEKLPAETASQPAEKQDYAADPTWVTLEREWKIAQHALEQERERLGDANPEVAVRAKDVEFREQLLRDRETQLDRLPPAAANRTHSLTSLGGFPAFESQAPRERLHMLDQAIDAQQQVIRETENRIKQISELVEEFTRNERELRGNREKYENVAAAIAEKEQARRVPGSIKIASDALTPTKPYRDRRMVLTGMVLFAALGLGIGVGYLRAILDARVEGASGAQQATSSPFLGQLPRVRDPWKPDLLSGQIQRECVRMVRTAMMERLGGLKGGTVLVTSAGPRAGKTTLSSLLARSIAECGKSVLLIDADQRRSSIADFFGFENGPGLDEVIVGNARDEDAIFAGPSEGLWVLPAAATPKESHTERLASGGFDVCLRRWKARFDTIVIDSPPLLPVADARILASKVDGTIFVMRADHCRRNDVLNALGALSVAGGRLIGTVLTGARPPRSYLAEYGHYYGPAAAG